MDDKRKAAFTYAYLANANLIDTLTAPSGLVQDINWEARGLLSSITTRDSVSTVLKTFTYGLDALGQRPPSPVKTMPSSRWATMRAAKSYPAKKPPQALPPSPPPPPTSPIPSTNTPPSLKPPSPSIPPSI